MDKRILKKLSAAFMLSAVVLQTAAPTMLSASEIIKEEVSEREVQEVVEQEVDTDVTSEEVEVVASEDEDIEVVTETEKEANAPNEEEATIEANEVDSEEVDSTEVEVKTTSLGDEEDTTVTEVGYDELLTDTTLVNKQAMVKTYSQSNVYSYNLDASSTFDDGLVALGLLSAARNYDDVNGGTAGYDEAVSIIDGNGILNEEVFYSIVDNDFATYNKDTYVTIDNDYVFKITDNNVKVILTGSGIHGVLEDEDGSMISMRYSGSGITEVADSSLFTFSMTGINPDYTADGHFLSGYTTANGLYASYLTNGSQYLECLEFGQNVPSSVVDVTSENQLGDYWNAASDNTKKTVISLGYALEEQDSNGSSKLTEKEKSQGQYAIWTALVNNMSNLDNIQAKLEDNLSSGSFGSTFDSLFTSAQSFKDDGIDLDTVEYNDWAGRPSSDASNTQSVMVIEYMAPVVNPVYGDLEVIKTFNNTSYQEVDEVCSEIKVTVSNSAIGYSQEKTLTRSGSSCVATWSNLEPYSTYTVEETVNNSDYWIIKNGSTTAYVNPDDTTTVSGSTGIVNETQVADVIVYKDFTNPTSISTQDLVDPSDVKVSITTNSGTPVFTSPSNFTNKSLAWPTTAQQSLYGLDADQAFYRFNNLVPGSYTLTETYPDYLGGVTTSTTFTVSKSEAQAASAGAIKTAANHLTNKVIAGNVTIEKDWSNSGLNSNIDEEDVINSSNRVSPSDFQVEITGESGIATEYGTQTFTFNSNYKITTAAKSMPKGTYSYKEINNSNGAHVVTSSGTFTITSDGQTVDLTNNKIVNSLDLGSISVQKTIDLNDVEQYCAGTEYDNLDGEDIVVDEDDCLEFDVTDVVANGDVEVTITSNSSNGFSYTETKPLKWSGNTYGTSFTGLPEGSYTVTESYIAGQMAGVTTSQTVTINNDGQTVNAHGLENEILAGRLNITKRDADTGGIIGGGIGGNSDKRATFAIWDYDVTTGTITGDLPIDVISTNVDGEATSRWIPLLNSGTRTVFVQEVDAPDGYFLNGVETPNLNEGGYVYQLTAGNSGETVELTYDDVEIEDGEIKINKVITNTDNEVLDEEALEGFEFTIYNNVESLPNYGEIADGFESQVGVGEELPQVLYTDNLGEALSNKLIANYSDNSIGSSPVNVDMEYLLSETNVPEGYEWMYITPEDLEFTMTEDNIVYNFSFVNILKDIIININKVDEDGLAIEGVEFTVYDNAVQDSETGIWAFNNDDIVGTYVTDENGQIKMDKMPVNHTYYVVETATKVGEDGQDMYYYSEDPVVFTAEYIQSITDVDSDVIEVTETIQNENKTGSIELNKFDDLGTQALSGAEFEFAYNYNGVDAVNTYTVDESLLIEDLYVYNSDGSYITYTVTETKAPNGYYVVEPFTFHFEQDSKGNITAILDEENEAVTAEQAEMVEEEITEETSEVTEEEEEETSTLSNWSLFSLFNSEENNIVTTMNVYDKRIVVDLNLLKLTEDSATLETALDINTEAEYQDAATGMVQVDEDGNVVNSNSVSLEDKIEAHTPNDSTRLEGAEFTITTYFDRDMLSAAGYEVIDGVITEKTEENTDTAGEVVEDEEVEVEDTLDNLYPGYDVTLEVIETLSAGYKTAINEATTFTVDATEEVVTVKMNSLTYLFEYTEGMSFDIMGTEATTTNVVEANTSNVYVANPGDVIILNQDTNVVKPNVEIKETSDVLTLTQTTDENGHLNAVVPAYDANNMPIIYAIEEVKAPEGYAIIEDPMYVYFTIDADGYAVANILSESTNLNVEGPTDLVSPNYDFWNFDYTALFNHAFMEEVEVSGATKYIIDITESWKDATKDVEFDDYVLEVWLNVYNSLITGNLLINKEVNDSTLTSLEETKEYLETYATNGYTVITKAEYEALQNIASENLNNEETSKAYSDTLDNDNYSVLDATNNDVNTIITSNLAGTYQLVNFSSNVAINGEKVEFDEDDNASVTITRGDLVTMSKGSIAIAAVVNGEDKEFSQEPGQTIASYTKGKQFTVTAETAGEYYVSFDNAEVSYNGYNFAKEDGQMLINLNTGDVVKVLEGTITFLEVVESGINLALEKEYTGDLTNDQEVIVTEDGDITGGNTEWRLWNDETNESYAYDKTLLASDDGRVYFDGFSILNHEDEEIVYHLQEVGAPSPIIADATVTSFTFNIDSEGNLIATTEDKLTYTSAGTINSVTNTVNDAELGSYQTAEEAGSDLVYETYREDAIFKVIEAEKTVVDESEDQVVTEGESINYTIKITNNGASDSEITVQDTLEGLDMWFNIDEDALAQELIINETSTTQTNAFVDAEEEVEVTNLNNKLEKGSVVTIAASQAGNYNVEIEAGSVVTVNNSTKLYDKAAELNVNLNANDVITVTNGSVLLTSTAVAEEVTYTLQNLVDGFVYDLGSFTSVEFTFTLVAKDEFEEEAYCQKATNIATIDVTYPEKPEVDVETLKPEVDIDIVCKEDEEAKTVKAIPVVLENTGAQIAIFAIVAVIVSSIALVLKKGTSNKKVVKRNKR